MKCPNCKTEIPNKEEMVKIAKPEKKQEFWVKRNKTRPISDIIYFHPTEGRYVICSRCETLISI
tara:strand:- start:167 stop:358 length:192 start_codon:yes stop_codon:yes gene_type:complete